MLDALKKGSKAVGVKQTKKAVQSGQAECVYIAQNADPIVTDPVVGLCETHGISVNYVSSMSVLGEACGIKVGAAVAALLR